MKLDEWAKKWNISDMAMMDFKYHCGLVPTDVPLIPGTSEAGVTSQVRLSASKNGWRLWRNNVGATVDEYGNFIRYGLCNDSAQMNKKIKSSDLVGIKPIKITQDMVGRVVGQFVAREVKAANWTYRGSDHELAQLAFINLVNSLGGDACFTNS